MKIVYSLEERKIAIKTYKRLKSYTKTIRLLGYPSRHVLVDWVKNPQQFTKEKPKTIQKPAKQYAWKYKKLVVYEAMKGARVEDLALKYSITNGAHIYKWVKNYKKYGDKGLLTKKEKVNKGLIKTRKQFEEELPDNKTELKNLHLNYL